MCRGKEQKCIFAVPNERDRGDRENGRFIERMKKDVANTQGFF